MPPAPPVLEVRGITKRFPGVLANDNINLTLRKGQVLGLLGEIGAGKSTLMNMIYGLYRPNEGEILVEALIGMRDAGAGILLVSSVDGAVIIFRANPPWRNRSAQASERAFRRRNVRGTASARCLRPPSAGCRKALGSVRPFRMRRQMLFCG